MLLVFMPATRAASPRSHSRLNLNESTLDGSASGARKARSASRSTSMPGRRNPWARSSRSTAEMSGSSGVHDPQQAAQERRQPVRQPVHRAEVEHAQPAVVEQPEVARVRVRVQQPGPRRAGEQEPGEQDAGPVPFLLAAVADDPGQRGAVHPLGDQYLAGGQDDPRHVDVGVAGVRGANARCEPASSQ